MRAGPIRLVKQVRTAALLAAVALMLKAGGLARTQRLLAAAADRLHRRHPRAGEPVTLARGLACHLAASNARLPRPVRCLPLSLLLWAVLRRSGVSAELRIGVTLAGGFSAHAWVEVGGIPVNDSNDVGRRFRLLGVMT